MLNAVSEILSEGKGLDIDDSFGWTHNDSLIKIPHIDNAIIITNPPYRTSQSAHRRGIEYKNYLDNSPYNNLYLVALDRILDASDYAVAIIPESFIHSNYRRKGRLNLIDVIERNPFDDTDVPVCICCFDPYMKGLGEVRVFKNSVFSDSLEGILSTLPQPQYTIPMSFNDPEGWLALRAIDGTNDRDFIKFDFRENFDYDWRRMNKCSRFYTLIDIDIPTEKRQELIDRSNSITSDIRRASQDLALSPFMNNTKSGARRRRLPLIPARAIVERACADMGLIPVKRGLFD